jgi:hypothetical protein
MRSGASRRCCLELLPTGWSFDLFADMASVGEIPSVVPAVQLGSSRVDIVVGGHSERSDWVGNFAATPSGGTHVECLELSGGRLGCRGRRIDGNLRSRLARLNRADSGVVVADVTSAFGAIATTFAFA